MTIEFVFGATLVITLAGCLLASVVFDKVIKK